MLTHEVFFFFHGASGFEDIPHVPSPGPIQGAGGSASFWPGYIPPKRKKKKKEEEVVVEVAIEQIKEEQVVKYVAVQSVPISYVFPQADIIEQIQPLIKLLENNAIRSKIVKEKIEELEEEEDIIAIVRLLQ